MGTDDEPIGNGSAASDGESGQWTVGQIPDDISELQQDIDAFHREERWRMRRERAARRRDNAHPAWRWMLPRVKPVAPGFRPRQHSVLVPLTMTGIALVLCAAVTVLLTLFAPHTGRETRTPQPLFDTTQVGVTYGLLPNVEVFDQQGTAVQIRTIRPTVLILHPRSCNCADLLRGLAQDDVSQGVKTVVVTPEPRGSQTPSDVEQVSSLLAYDDPTDAIADSIQPPLDPTKPAAIIILENGEIGQILPYSELTATNLASDLQDIFDSYPGKPLRQ